MKKHVVKYPGSIKKALLTMEDMKKYRAYSIASKAGLPEGTLFDMAAVMNDEGIGHTTFTIVLPTGEAFSGFAIKKRGDEDDNEAASCIAAGRAVAVWKAYPLLPKQIQEIYDGLQKQQMEVADAAIRITLEKIRLEERKNAAPGHFRAEDEHRKTFAGRQSEAEAQSADAYLRSDPLDQLFARIRKGHLMSYSTDIEELPGGRQGKRTYTIVTT